MQKNITEILPQQDVLYYHFPQVAKDIKTLNHKYFKEYIYPDNTRCVMINNADWFGAIYDLFNAGVVWGKRMERARRKAKK